MRPWNIRSGQKRNELVSLIGNLGYQVGFSPEPIDKVFDRLVLASGPSDVSEFGGEGRTGRSEFVLAYGGSCD